MQTSNTKKIINAILMGKNKDTCFCPVPIIVPKFKTAENNPNQTTAQRISHDLQYSLGGKISFGILGKPIVLNYLGGRAGQPGGITMPIRNKF